jgi:tRNA(adenine34) deaminase
MVFHSITGHTRFPMNDDEYWMQKAITLAKQAETQGEVPVGALVVKENELLGQGWNRPISSHDPSAHAEIVAIREAASSTGNYRLPGTTMYVTLEPCVMCAGAIMHARISRVIFGAYDQKAGAAGSIIDIFSNPKLNHHAEIVCGIFEQECADLLKQFFLSRR